MGIFRWPDPARDAPLPQIIDLLARFFKQSDAALVGGDRAHGALDSNKTLQTGVAGNATIAGKPAGGVAAVFATEWMETFEVAPSDWIVVLGARNYTIVSTGQTGGSALRQTGTLTLAFPWKVPYDASKLYRLRARVKRVSGSGQFTYGLRCLDVAGTVIATVAACCSGVTPALGSYGAEFTGWVKGYGAFVVPSADPTAPSALPSGTVALQPFLTLNSGDAAGVMDVDYLDYDRQDEEASKRTYNSLIPSTDPRYATGARVAVDAIDSPAIQRDVTLVGKLQSFTDPTIFIDLRTTPAPGAIIVSLPGYTADNLGNGDFGGTVSATRFEATTATFKATVEIGRAGTGTGVLAIWNNNAGAWPLLMYTSGGGGPALVSVLKAQNSSFLFLVAPNTTGVVIAGNDLATAPVPVTIYGSLTVTSSVGGSGVVSAETITQTAGAVNIVGSRTTNVDTILNAFLNAMAARGFVVNSTTP